MITGFAAGMLVPLLALLLFKMTAFEDLTISGFLRQMFIRGKLSSVISLGLIPNLLVFFIFIWLNYLYSARGVVAATLVYGLVVVITKYLI